MANKTKNTKTAANTIQEIATNTGILLMTAATTLGMVEVPQQPDKRVILTAQPSFAFAGDNTQQGDNPLRREREETGPHYISYNISQRTPGRTGKI